MTRAAVAGIGQTRYAKNMGRTEVDLACRGDPRRVRRRGPPGRRDRRLRELPRRAGRRGRAGHDARDPRAALHGAHAVGRRRRGVAARAGRDRGRERHRRVRGRVPVAQPLEGRVVRRRSQPGRAAVGEGRRPAARLPAVAAPVRRRVARAGDGADRAPAHARVRHARRALRHAGGRAALPREPQSRRDHARRRSRSTTGRRRVRSPSRSGCSTARSRTTARPRCSSRRSSGPATSRQPAVPVLAQVQYGAPIHTELAAFFATTAAFGERDGGAVTAGRRLFGAAGRHAGRRRRRDDRRAVHDRGAARARAVRVLRDGRGRAVHRERRDPLARRRAAGQHARRLERRGVRARREPPARRRCASCGGPRAIRWRAPRSRSCAARSATRRARCCSESTGERADAAARSRPNADDARVLGRAARRRAAHPAVRGVRRRSGIRPGPVCAQCGATEREWHAGRAAPGEVWSFTVVHPPTLPGVRRPHALRRGRRAARRRRVPREQPRRLPGRRARGRRAGRARADASRRRHGCRRRLRAAAASGAWRLTASAGDVLERRDRLPVTRRAGCDESYSWSRQLSSAEYLPACSDEYGPEPRFSMGPKWSTVYIQLALLRYWPTFSPMSWNIVSVWHASLIVP